MEQSVGTTFVHFRADDDEEEGAKDGDVKNLLDGVQQLFDGKVVSQQCVHNIMVSIIAQ